MILSKNSHVLFYGDSITDCGRNRDDINSLGSGYAFLIAGRLQSAYPGWNLKFTNKGIGGNRVYDLEERLEKDVLALKPDVVSIMIGVNDTWRRYDSNVVSQIDEFQASYDRILTRITTELTSRVILLEPFLLPVPEDRKKWREDLDPRITAVRELAWKYKVPYVALDGIFATAATMAPANYWLPDGVHPSVAGHGLIASAWIRAIKS